jgi:hypothetical protein
MTGMVQAGYDSRWLGWTPAGSLRRRSLRERRLYSYRSGHLRSTLSEPRRMSGMVQNQTSAASGLGRRPKGDAPGSEATLGDRWELPNPLSWCGHRPPSGAMAGGQFRTHTGRLPAPVALPDVSAFLNHAVKRTAKGALVSVKSATGPKDAMSAALIDWRDRSDS